MISYTEAIRTFEGFSPQAKLDYTQLSNGYGTRALFPGEVIDGAEASKRFAAAVASARAVVDRHAPQIDEGTKAALTSLTYNAGDSWVHSELGQAVAHGDLDQVRSIFQEYNKAGGTVLPGLVSRRAAEALWIGNPEMVGGITVQPPKAVETAAAAEGVASPATSPENLAAPDIGATAPEALASAETKLKPEQHTENFRVATASLLSSGATTRMDMLTAALSRSGAQASLANDLLNATSTPAEGYGQISAFSANSLAEIARLVQLQNSHQFAIGDSDRNADGERRSA